MPQYKVCAYWSARKETLDSCDESLGRFLSRLSACDEAFASWYERRSSRRKATQNNIDFKNRDRLRALLERGMNRRDIGKEVMEDLGCSIGMWNGGMPTRAAGLKLTCGLFSTAPGLGGNSLVIDLPEELGGLQQP